MAQHTLEHLAHALYQGSAVPAVASREMLGEIITELEQIIQQSHHRALQQTSIHSYVWLSL